MEKVEVDLDPSDLEVYLPRSSGLALSGETMVIVSAKSDVL